MTERYWFTDTVTTPLTPIDTDGDAIDDFTIDQTTAVEIGDDPWIDFFGTDTFYRFDATVTRPIEQTYHFGDEELVFKKPEAELRESTWQLDNIPWTVTHPDERRVTNVDQMRGFFRNPHYEDGQQARLYVPETDDEALQFIADTKAVSVGFQAEVEWADDDEDIDGRQYNLIHNHVAGVRNGRCPVEEGCGIHTDGATNVMVDAVQTQSTEEEMVVNAIENTWVTHTAEEARVLADELGCNGVHKTVKDGDEYWMPCNSMAKFRELTDTDHEDCSEGPCQCGEHIETDCGCEYGETAIPFDSITASDLTDDIHVTR